MGGKQKRRLLPESTSHHPEFLDKRRQLQKRSPSSLTDCSNNQSSNKLGQEAFSSSSPGVRIPRRSCLLLCFFLDIITSNKAFVNLINQALLEFVFVIKNSVFRAELLQFPQERLDVRVMNFTAQPTTCVSTITGSVMEKKTALMGLMNQVALQPHRSQHPPTDLLMLQTATLTRTCVCGSLLGSQI